MLRPLIIIMAKAPRAGAVKTRLSPLLSEAAIVQIATAFVEDTVAKAKCVTPHVMLAYAPSDGREVLQEILRDHLEPDSLMWLEQQDQDLGTRLQAATRHGATLGFSPIIILGTDSPTLPPLFLQNAILALTTGVADVVLGPAEDGGFYLAGMREPVCELYKGVAWSTSSVLAQTAANVAALKLRLMQLPTWYDVDTPADLLRLYRDIAVNSEARSCAPMTAQWMASHVAELRGSIA